MSLEVNDKNQSICDFYHLFLAGNLPGLGNPNMIPSALFTRTLSKDPGFFPVAHRLLEL